MFKSCLLIISILALAVFSGLNQSIENISLIVTIILAMVSFLSMYTENKIQSTTNKILKCIGRCGWVIAILFYAAYGLWIQCIAMILTVIFIKNYGVFYKPEIERKS